MNELKQELLALPVIKRIKELENYIDTNPLINQKLSELKQLAKQVVNAKAANQPRQQQVYQKAYDQKYEEILDLPFVEEYLDLLEQANTILDQVTKTIEDYINTKLNS